MISPKLLSWKGAVSEPNADLPEVDSGPGIQCKGFLGRWSRVVVEGMEEGILDTKGYINEQMTTWVTGLSWRPHQGRSCAPQRLRKPETCPSLVLLPAPFDQEVQVPEAVAGPRRCYRAASHHGTNLEVSVHSL